MSHFLQLFSENLVNTWKRDSFLEKLSVLATSIIFHTFSRNEPPFATFFPKSSSKPRNLIVCSKTCKFWPNRRFFMVFHEMSLFSTLCSEKFVKTSKRDSLLEKLQVLAKSTIFHAFLQNEQLFATFFGKVGQNLER